LDQIECAQLIASLEDKSDRRICDHAHCIDCIETFLSFNYRLLCPTCRQPFTQFRSLDFSTGEAAFQLFDQNRDDQISADEFRRALRALQLPIPDSDALFRLLTGNSEAEYQLDESRFLLLWRWMLMEFNDWLHWDQERLNPRRHLRHQIENRAAVAGGSADDDTIFQLTDFSGDSYLTNAELQQVLEQENFRIQVRLRRMVNRLQSTIHDIVNGADHVNHRDWAVVGLFMIALMMLSYLLSGAGLIPLGPLDLQVVCVSLLSGARNSSCLCSIILIYYNDTHISVAKQYAIISRLLLFRFSLLNRVCMINRDGFLCNTLAQQNV
jgi:Ca2+-binding EF-hand superfamily protein